MAVRWVMTRRLWLCKLCCRLLWLQLNKFHGILPVRKHTYQCIWATPAEIYQVMCRINKLVAVCPPSASKDGAPRYRVSCMEILCMHRTKGDAYPCCGPQVLDDPFYPVHNIPPHGFLLWPWRDEIEEIHYFFMQTEIKTECQGSRAEYWKQDKICDLKPVIVWKKKKKKGWCTATEDRLWKWLFSVWPRHWSGSLPINARAVPPGFPQAAWGVQVESIRDEGQERVDAVESVGPVQVPPPARWVWLVVVVVVLVPVLMLHPGGGVAERLLHAATVLLCTVERRRDMLPSQVVLVQLAFAVMQEAAGLFGDV